MWQLLPAVKVCSRIVHESANQAVAACGRKHHIRRIAKERLPLVGQGYRQEIRHRALPPSPFGKSGSSSEKQDTAATAVGELFDEI